MSKTIEKIGYRKYRIGDAMYSFEHDAGIMQWEIVVSGNRDLKYPQKDDPDPIMYIVEDDLMQAIKELLKDIQSE